MATITIKCRHPGYDLKPNDFVHLSYKPGCLSNVVIFMWEKKFAHYCLLINGREYEWPSQILKLHEHLDYCVKLDKAFYG